MLQQHNLRSSANQAAGLILSHNKPFLSGTAACFPIPPKNNSVAGGKSRTTFPALQRRRSYSSSSTVKAISTFFTGKLTNLKARITVLQTIGGAITQPGLPQTIGDALTQLGVSQGINDASDLLGAAGLQIELVSADLDSSGKEKSTVKENAAKVGISENEVYYEANFKIPENFGEIGAILVENEHVTEMFVQDILLQGSYINDASINVNCESWVHPKVQNPEKRVFFCNKSFLPSQTPSGLKRYRERELQILRGDGKGERKTSDRIYDYDVYNDLGVPEDDGLARPVLGGSEHPYPRRCRTGRPMSETDPSSESRSSTVYVPRDEAFSEVKQATFSVKTVSSVIHGVVPILKSTALGTEQAFPNFTDINILYNEGVKLPDVPATALLGTIIPRIIRTANNTANNVLQFDTPELMDRDTFSWIRDSEFARQTIAGLNPLCLKLVTEWPIKSTLDPNVYGPAESAITTKIVEEEIGGLMTVEEAINQKKLFVLDYHDVLMPYVSKVRELNDTTLYGSRTLFFLTSDGTLRPLAIELSLPPMDGKPHWKEVYVECWNATGVWLWRLAKAHVQAHDSGVHQLVSHWLRTHACTEPYIIATHRQLSAMHPIYRLLHPHFRYTMEINALARGSLINAGGIIERTFSPGKYSIELSSLAYDKLWRFDHEALPADLINRGMAVEDPESPHGLKLTIPDYPYAVDGLLIWDAIKQWVTDYVSYYYPEESLVQSDSELQEWWTEIRTVGHGDKKDEEWWPELKTPGDLIGILNTIIWVTSGHHAAVNFGQYDFGGYFPNRPTITRKKMPNEALSEADKKKFLEKPERFLLDSFPSQFQASMVMSILDVLSTHSPDEEYLGDQIQPFYAQEKVIKAAFERFSGRLKEIEGIIDARNADTSNLNRTGAGIVPYQLLKPFSGPGVTGRGIPNSISI